ncbi:MAG: MOSC domain-containing protein [Halofilum sp. (in: g-proteobacteria)]|nr:MOSC domain-containing protein [Halofilum sp. (in: g-proteobacteria)]
MDPRPAVARAWRYPVKSMRGQAAGHIDVADIGVAGDRRYALRDPHGRLGSGKATGRFRRVDGLLRYRARYDAAGDVIITFPDGREWRADDPAIDAALAAALGQALTLERVEDGSHLDSGPLHVLTTASLAWLADTLVDVEADERRFRPNLVVDVPGAEPVEQGWIGATLRGGDEVVLRVTEPTERCGLVALAQAGLRHDPRVLRHITRDAGLMFGVYAEVVIPGRIRVGDAVRVEPGG